MTSRYDLRCADVLTALQEVSSATFQCVVTSPPYWGLRDYGIEPSVWGGDAACSHAWSDKVISRGLTGGVGAGTLSGTQQGAVKGVDIRFKSTTSAFCKCGAWRGCLGLEPTPELFIGHMVTVFREVRRVLRDDGTLWLNIGDSYAGAGLTGGKNPAVAGTFSFRGSMAAGRINAPGCKPKDLVGIPWMLAFALRADGWYLRAEIIWHKPNPMPESVTDRPTKAHETIFLLSKSARYFYDAAAIMEPAQDVGRYTKMPDGWDTADGAHGTVHRSGREKGERVDKQRGHGRRHAGFNDRWDAMSRAEQMAHGRNKRSVWTIATRPFPDAHFATFPEEIPRIGIAAGSRVDDIVLDPFSGAGTTGLVALELGRRYYGIDRSAAYTAMAERRLRQVNAWQPSLLTAEPLPE